MKSNSKLGLAVHLLIVVILISTVIYTTMGSSDEELVTKVSPSDYTLEPGSVFPGGNLSSDTILLSGDEYSAMPITAPLLPLKGINTYIDRGKGDEADASDVSYYSSVVALTFFDRPGHAIVVENYTSALLAVPLSVTLKAPILVQGPTTNEALYRLGTTGKGEIISIGHTHFSGEVRASFQARDGNISTLALQVADYTLGIMRENGKGADYITVANPEDFNESYADIPHLSAFSATLTAYRGGILLTVERNNTSINATIHSAVEKMEKHGFTPKFLAMVGDAKSLPFNHRYFANYDEDGYPGENPVPSDNPYADIDGNPFTLEMTEGRIIGKTLADVSSYFDRVIHYKDYLDTTSSPTVNAPSLGLNWNNNAVVYCAAGAEFDPRSENEEWKLFYDKGGFDTQDDSAYGHSTSGDLTPEEINMLTIDFSRSNFIAINADHGNPYETLTFKSSALKPMHPGVLFAVSCNLGRIDNVDINRSIAYTMLEKGLNAYLAPTRITYGVISSDTFEPKVNYDKDKAANGLSRLFFDHLINENTTVGEAFQYAVNTLATSDKWGGVNDENWEINLCVVWEYHLYGDPAFNPYEPANEGKA